MHTGFGLPAIPFLSALLLSVGLLCSSGTTGKSNRYAVLICADAFLFLFGLSMVRQNDQRLRADHYSNLVQADSSHIFSCLVKDLPVIKERSVKIEVKILQVKKGGKFLPAEGRLLLYLERCERSLALRHGDNLLVNTRLNAVPGPANPYEFNYRDFLARKQIFHSGFVKCDSYRKLEPVNKLNALWQFGLTCRAAILHALRDSKLTPTSFGICAALLTGYDDDIEKPVLETFAHSGTLHVLSVSGLHTGLIYLLLDFLFNFIDRKRKYKIARMVFITIFLWGFALMTGFAAPVLRAVIMFNLMGVGRIWFRSDYRHHLNILFASAFIILCADPLLIEDMGFLLSYCAMFGLIYFQPMFNEIWRPENKISNYAWQSFTASLSATISTLPITLFCFNQFPIWFFVCNLVVVPLSFAALLLSILIVIKINLVVPVVNVLVKIMLSFTALFNSRGFGFIDNIHFTFLDACFLCAVTVLLVLGFTQRSYRAVLVSILLVICWQATNLLEVYRVKKSDDLTIFQLKNKSAWGVKTGGRLNLYITDPLSYAFHVRPYHNNLSYPELKDTKINTVRSQQSCFLFVTERGKRPAISEALVTTIILCNNVRITPEDLRLFPNLRLIVADGSNNRHTVKVTEQICRKFGFGFYSTSARGAYQEAL